LDQSIHRELDLVDVLFLDYLGIGDWSIAERGWNGIPKGVERQFTALIPETRANSLSVI
jgi:hypothetical protein